MANYTSSYTGQQIDTAIGNVANKVDKVQGKELSTNDFTNELKTKLDGIDMSTKVDKVEGKGLSTNDYTTEEKTKLAGIADGATKVTKTSDITNDSGFITSSHHDSSKQDTLVSGTNIKTINGNSVLGSGNLVIEGGSGGLSSVAHDDTMTGAGTNASPLGVDSSKYATAAQGAKADTAVQPGDLGTLATKDTVNYETEVTNKPTIPTNSDFTLNGLSEKSYNNLTDKPNIPTKTSDITNDSGFITKSVNDLTNYTKTSDLGSLATKSSVDYETEVTNKPTIPTVDVNKNYVDTELAKKQNTINSSNKLPASNVSGLSTVATSGSYNDLSNKPTIPSEVTESTVSGWGFTKNTGTYSKPSGGIPKTDLASAVQTSLGKADTALQSVPNTYRTSADQDVIDNGKQATLVSGTNIKTINNTSILGSGNIDIQGGEIDLNTKYSSMLAPIGSNLTGKKCVFIGDSITQGVGASPASNNYVNQFATLTGATVVNLGVSGTVLCQNGGRTCNIGKLDQVPSDADYVFILMGVNDWDQASNRPTINKLWYDLGDIDSTDTKTIYGALKLWNERIEQIKAQSGYENIQFIWMTPVITSWSNSYTDGTTSYLKVGSGYDQNKTCAWGYKFRDLCQAIIDVAALFNLPVIDLNLYSGIYYWSENNKSTQTYFGDGIHPNNAGHLQMATAIKNYLDTDTTKYTNFFMGGDYNAYCRLYNFLSNQFASQAMFPYKEIAYILPTSITLSASSSSVEAGQTLQITETVLPANATNKNVTWTSSDTSKATVSATGLVTAVAAGSVTITATSTVASSVTGTLSLTVTPAQSKEITGINVTAPKTEIVVNEGITLTATLVPSDTTETGITWSTDNAAVTIVPNGTTCTVTGASVGQATVTCTSSVRSSVSGSVFLTVNSQPVAPTSVELSATTTSLNVGETQQITATFQPSGVTETGLTWSTSDSEKATISSSGMLTAVGSGTVTITATSTYDQSISDTIEFTISAPALTGITINATSEQIGVGDTATLTAILTPATTSETGVTWTSSDPSVTIEPNGLTCVATGASLGSATITCTSTVHSEISATKTITVSNSIDLSTLQFTSGSDIAAGALSYNTTSHTLTSTYTASGVQALKKTNQVFLSNYGLQAGMELEFTINRNAVSSNLLSFGLCTSTAFDSIPLSYTQAGFTCGQNNIYVDGTKTNVSELLIDNHTVIGTISEFAELTVKFLRDVDGTVHRYINGTLLEDFPPAGASSTAAYEYGQQQHDLADAAENLYLMLPIGAVNSVVFTYFGQTRE